MKGIFNVSINLSQIPEERVITTNKDGIPFKDGQRFVKLTIFLNEEKDQFGKNIKIILTKANKEEETIYVGDGIINMENDLD